MACFSASSDVIHSSKCFFEICFLYIVLIIAFASTYALYGIVPSIINALKMLPLNPDIFGVNVFCFSSPSFLKIIILNISNKNGKIRIANSINIVLLTLLAYVILIIFAKIIATIMLISNKLLRKLSNILYLDNKFNGLFFPNQLVICQSPRVHLANLFIKLLYLLGYPSISIISETRPHLKYEPSNKSWLRTVFSGIAPCITSENTFKSYIPFPVKIPSLKLS